MAVVFVLSEAYRLKQSYCLVTYLYKVILNDQQSEKQYAEAKCRKIMLRLNVVKYSSAFAT